MLLLKKIFSHVSSGLKFTISLKIITKNYFQLNCTGKFSVALLHTITISKNKLGHVTLPESKMVERDVSISHCTDFVFLSIYTLFWIGLVFHWACIECFMFRARYDSDDLLSISEWPLQMSLTLFSLTRSHLTPVCFSRVPGSCTTTNKQSLSL